MGKIITSFFLLILLLLSFQTNVGAQACINPRNYCLCEPGPTCCDIEGPDGYNCGGGGSGGCTTSNQCGGGNVCCQGQCVGAGQCGGGGNQCRDATVNCPLNSTIAVNQPLYNVCSFEFGGNFCQPPGSAQLPTGCCVASGQNGCGNTQYTTYACCPANTVDTCTLGNTYTKNNGCGNPLACNDDDVYISHTRNAIAGVCGQECTSYKPDGSCRAGAYIDVYGYVTTCQTKTCSCVSTCTTSVPSNATNPTPVNGSTVTTTTFNLSWSPPTNWGSGCPSNNNRYFVYIGVDSPANMALVQTTNNTSTSFTGVSGKTYYWKIYPNNGSVSALAPVDWSFTINVPPVVTTPWWQIKDGDVTATGDITSVVPSAQLFDIVGLGGYPGVPVYSGAFNLTSDTSKISVPKWNANTATVQSRLFNYSFFSNLIPDDVNFNDVSTLVAGGTQYTDGYEWYRATGDVSTSGDINIGSRKVILFVENGNFNINGKINVDNGIGFFGVFVDGNIVVANTVAGAPSIEGVYLSDGSFSTGAGTSQLHVRGSVASFGGTSLQRDLTANSTPAELFEFAPDQMLLFPEKLMFKRSKWAEIAP